MSDGKPNGKEPRRNSIEPLDLRACMLRTPPPRSWVIRDWIPRGSVTLLAGSGGLGKSLIAQQLGTAITANVDFLGQIEQPGSVLYLACEEDGDELWRRQVGICDAMGIPMRAVCDDLWLDARSGIDSTLCAYHHGEMMPTPLMHDISERLAEMAHPQLVIIDNVAHVFNAGESGENDRSKVARFLGLLSHMTREWNIGCLLIGHPGKAVGSQYSGSTAWSDLARSRLFLGRRDKDAPLRLTRPKGNYASVDDDGVELEWKNGAFLRVDYRETPMQALQNSRREAEAETIVTRAVIYFTAREQNTSEKPRAQNFLPRLMAERGKDEGFTRAELHAALLRLLDADKLRAAQPLPWLAVNRVPAVGLVLNGQLSSAHRLATDEQPMSTPDDTPTVPH